MTGSRASAVAAALHLFLAAGLAAQTSPASNAGFMLVEQAPVAGANAGTMYRYQRPDGVGVELFVTPLPPSLDPCVAACATRAVELISSQLVRELLIVRARGPSDSVRRAGSTAVAPPEGSWLERGRLTAMREYRDGRAADSYLWLFLGQETLVQVRGASPAGRIDFATLGRFVDTLLLTVPPTYDCSDGVATDSTILTVYSTEGPRPRLSRIVDSTLGALGYQFAYHSESRGLWRTVPRSVWPAGSELAQAVGDHRPGIELVATTAADSGSSVIALSARAVCLLPASVRSSGASGAELATLAMQHALDAILAGLGIVK